MRNYLILREKARAFQADREVRQALADARVDQLFEPTLAEGETVESLARRDVRPRGGGATGNGLRATGPVGAGAPVRRARLTVAGVAAATPFGIVGVQAMDDGAALLADLELLRPPQTAWPLRRR
jgi:hypothetical protein